MTRSVELRRAGNPVAAGVLSLVGILGLVGVALVVGFGLQVMLAK